MKWMKRLTAAAIAGILSLSQLTAGVTVSFAAESPTSFSVGHTIAANDDAEYSAKVTIKNESYSSNCYEPQYLTLSFKSDVPVSTLKGSILVDGRSRRDCSLLECKSDIGKIESDAKNLSITLNCDEPVKEGTISLKVMFPDTYGSVSDRTDYHVSFDGGLFDTDGNAIENLECSEEVVSLMPVITSTTSSTTITSATTTKAATTTTTATTTQKPEVYVYFDRIYSSDGHWAVEMVIHSDSVNFQKLEGRLRYKENKYGEIVDWPYDKFSYFNCSSRSTRAGRLFWDNYDDGIYLNWSVSDKLDAVDWCRVKIGFDICYSTFLKGYLLFDGVIEDLNGNTYRVENSDGLEFYVWPYTTTTTTTKTTTTTTTSRTTTKGTTDTTRRTTASASYTTATTTSMTTQEPKAFVELKNGGFSDTKIIFKFTSEVPFKHIKGNLITKWLTGNPTDPARDSDLTYSCDIGKVYNSNSFGYEWALPDDHKPVKECSIILDVVPRYSSYSLSMLFSLEGTITDEYGNIYDLAKSNQIQMSPKALYATETTVTASTSTTKTTTTTTSCTTMKYTTASTSNTTSTTSLSTYTTQTTKVTTSNTTTSTSVTTVISTTLPSQSGAYVTVSGGGYIHMYDMFKVYVDYDLSQCKPEKITGQLLMQNFCFNPSIMYIISITSSCGKLEANLATGEYTILFTEEDQDVKNCRVTFRMENIDSGPYGEYFTESVDTAIYDNDGNEIPVLDMKNYHLQVAPPDAATDPLPQTGNNSPKTAAAAACAALLVIAGGLAMYRSRRDD